METHQLALLFAVALPVVLIAGINLLLALAGERDTLLLPLPRPMRFGEPLEALERSAPMRAAQAGEADRAAPEPSAEALPAPRGPAKRPFFGTHAAISALRRLGLADDAVRT